MGSWIAAGHAMNIRHQHWHLDCAYTAESYRLAQAYCLLLFRVRIIGKVWLRASLAKIVATRLK